MAIVGMDETIRLWHSETGACLGVISDPTLRDSWIGVVCHPHLPLVATVDLIR